MKITPCCKTKNWNFIAGRFDDETMIRCQSCDSKMGSGVLIEVQKGFNPTTFFCDSCHRSLEEESSLDTKKV